MSAATIDTDALWWVLVERLEEASVLVGPYADEEAARHAMNYAPHVDDLCEEGAIECLSFALKVEDIDPAWRVQHIDPRDPHHTGSNVARDGSEGEDEPEDDQETSHPLSVVYGPSEDPECKNPHCLY